MNVSMEKLNVNKTVKTQMDLMFVAAMKAIVVKELVEVYNHYNCQEYCNYYSVLAKLF